MPTSRATLSFVPNVLIANSLTNGGAASITRSPTSSTGERHARFSPARSSATPRAMAATTSPARIEKIRDGRRRSASGGACSSNGTSTTSGAAGGMVFTQVVRHRPPNRWSVRIGQVRRRRSTARSMTSRRRRRPVPSAAEPAQRRRDRHAVLVEVDEAGVDVGAAGDRRRVAEVRGDVDHRLADRPLARGSATSPRRPTRPAPRRRARCRATCGSPWPTPRRRRRP